MSATVEELLLKIFYFVKEVIICYLLTADQSQARTGAVLTNKSAAIVLCMYMASIIDNFAINTVGSRQKLQFISKQNNFQTENVYTFAMPTRE